MYDLWYYDSWQTRYTCDQFGASSVYIFIGCEFCTHRHTVVSQCLWRFLLGQQRSLFCQIFDVFSRGHHSCSQNQENVDADHVRTERSVESEQSIGLFIQREERDIEFRVSGLPHAVVKQAENFRVRELAKKIESHPHQRALQADLQQNIVYNPFSDESKAKIRDMGNVELFELCQKNPKVQCSECFPYWNQGTVCCTCGQSLGWKRIQSKFQSMAIGCFLNPELRHQEGATSRWSARQNWAHRKSISWPTMRGWDVSKRNLKEFTIDSNEIQHIVIRSSKLAGLKKRAFRWTN